MGGRKMSSQVFQVGDKVQFRLAGRSVAGHIREDRGPIGVGGRHLYLVVYALGKDDSYEIELPAEEIEAAEPKKEPA
jgi:hypothetical protein